MNRTAHAISLLPRRHATRLDVLQSGMFWRRFSKTPPNKPWLPCLTFLRRSCLKRNWTGLPGSLRAPELKAKNDFRAQRHPEDDHPAGLRQLDDAGSAP